MFVFFRGWDGRMEVQWVCHVHFPKSVEPELAASVTLDWPDCGQGGANRRKR